MIKILFILVVVLGFAVIDLISKVADLKLERDHYKALFEERKKFMAAENLEMQKLILETQETINKNVAELGKLVNKRA